VWVEGGVERYKCYSIKRQVTVTKTSTTGNGDDVLAGFDQKKESMGSK